MSFIFINPPFTIRRDFIISARIVSRSVFYKNTTNSQKIKI